jgi:membrane protein
VGLLIALGSANSGMAALFDALKVVYDEREKRSLVLLSQKAAAD